MCTPKIKSLATFNPLEQQETQNNMVTTCFHWACPLNEKDVIEQKVSMYAEYHFLLQLLRKKCSSFSCKVKKKLLLAKANRV